MVFHFSGKLLLIDGRPLFYNAQLSVDMFFILSGFVMSYSYRKRICDSMTFTTLLAKRVIRLYPMFIMSLLIAAAGAVLVDKLDYRIFLVNALFLPVLNTSYTEIFPANFPGWSLFFEMVMSCAFWFTARMSPKSMQALVVLSFCIFVTMGAIFSLSVGKIGINFDMGWSNQNFIGGFPRVCFGFSVGVCFYMLESGEIKSRSFDRLKAWAGRVPPLMLYGAAVTVFLFPAKVAGAFPFVALVLILPILVIVGMNSVCRTRHMKKLTVALGWISYPVYCLHIPILGLMRGLHQNAFGEFSVLILSLETLLLSVVITKFYEEPVRNFFKRITDRRRRDASVSHSN